MIQKLALGALALALAACVPQPPMPPAGQALLAMQEQQALSALQSMQQLQALHSQSLHRLQMQGATLPEAAAHGSPGAPPLTKQQVCSLLCPPEDLSDECSVLCLTPK